MLMFKADAASAAESLQTKNKKVISHNQTDSDSYKRHKTEENFTHFHIDGRKVRKTPQGLIKRQDLDV